jgi:hypothetical protein
MDGLVSKKNQKFWNIGIVSIIFILIISSFFQESRETLIYEDELKNEIRGVVLNKYIDSSDHSICKLKLNSGAVVSIWDNCYERVNVGDSIAKKKGSFDFVIYKPLDTIIVNIEENLISR